MRKARPTYEGLKMKDHRNVVDWKEHLLERDDRFWRFCALVELDQMFSFDTHHIAIITVECWRVLRRTPKGAWIAPPNSSKWSEEGCKRFVLDEGRKKYAYPSKKDAWESYLIRHKFRRHYWSVEGERLDAIDKLLDREDSVQG